MLWGPHLTKCRGDETSLGQNCLVIFRHSVFFSENGGLLKPRCVYRKTSGSTDFGFNMFFRRKRKAFQIVRRPQLNTFSAQHNPFLSSKLLFILQCK